MVNSITTPELGVNSFRANSTKGGKPRIQTPRRSHLEIHMDILRVIREGAHRPTQIMYGANLSWVTLCEHLSLLESRSMIQWSFEGERKWYELTVRGAHTICSWSRLREEVGVASATGGYSVPGHVELDINIDNTPGSNAGFVVDPMAR